jgi:hypothetical protein
VFSRGCINWSWVTPAFSEPSRMRNPSLLPEYMAWTIEVTVQSTQPEATEGAVAAVPVVGGCVFQVTTVSVHEAETWSACRLRPAAPELVYRRNVAEVTGHPKGIDGRVNLTSERASPPESERMP